MTKYKQGKGNESFNIASTDYWFKVIEMLQQNWALITPTDAGCFKVYFISDTSSVFDSLIFMTQFDAEVALARNGFRRYLEDPNAQTFIQPPQSPFCELPHPSGLIYSSGQFWG